MAKKQKTIDDRLKVSEVKPEEIINPVEEKSRKNVDEPEETTEETTEEKSRKNVDEPEETTEEKSRKNVDEPEETIEEKSRKNVDEPEETTAEKSEDQFNELLGKIEGATAPPSQKKERKPVIEKTARKKKKGESSPDSFRVEGYILMLLIDSVYPFAFATINNMLDKRIKLNSYDLQLDEKDFKKLEPLADQAADYMAVNLNPIAGFFLVATFMYGNNVISLRMKIEQELKQ